jgi:two-component system sensor histidine kinase/response regulator
MPTVLVVDDDVHVRTLVSDALQAHGFRVIAAPNGADAIALARRDRPDVVVCDVSMPGVDGHAVLASLRQASATAGIPFVFLTGESSRGDLRRGMEEGADDYVTKPFRLREVVEAVRTQLGKSEAARRRAEEQLEELRASMTRLFPHELLTPLTPLVGYAAFLRSAAETLTPPDLLQIAADIESSTRRLERMVRNILFYAGLEILRRSPAESAVLHEQPAPACGPLIEAAARRTSVRAGREADLRLDLADGAVAMPCEHVELIGEELVDNAFKFSEPGMPVDVRVRASGEVVTIAVTDRGRGMTSEEIRRIGAFLQFDRRKFEQQGAGLGLVLVLRIAELAGGSLSLRSVPGEGTTAEVAVPIPRRSPGSPPSA